METPPSAGSRLGVWFHPLGRTSRRSYAQWGFGLTALKFMLDRVIALTWGADYWSLYSYWRPTGALSTADGRIPSGLPLVLLAVALPFIGVGVLLTLRRLRDVGASPWLVLLFFLPGLNVVMFVLLCLVPSREYSPVASGVGGLMGWLNRMLGLHSRALSAAVAVLLTVLLVVPMTWLATVCFRDYGWGVFVAMPFLLGLVAAAVHGAPAPRGLGETIAVALLALLICAGVILAVALEGIICLVMAAPLAAPLVIFGAVVGYYLQRSWWKGTESALHLYAVGWIALPLAFLHESNTAAPPPLRSAVTTMEIAARPEVVWDHVVAFSELAPPDELVFRSGIAYPMRATLLGQGVGAVRRCEFSTGPFVEPITVWEPGRKLGFDVIEQPHPMHELSPYRALHPPHLEGFFLSRRGEFRLVALPNGHTRLEGTTWYTQKLWPSSYWHLWSDYLLHLIHGRVLQHIRTEAERAAAG